jgi:AcrR family transcriptional regulator
MASTKVNFISRRVRPAWTTPCRLTLTTAVAARKDGSVKCLKQVANREGRHVPRTALQKAREAPASTKARILQAAEAVFAARGFDGASTREIAAAAGVNISSLHYHWESKENLYLAVFQNIYDRIINLIRAAVPPVAGRRRDARALVDDLMGRIFDFFADHPDVTRLLVRRLLESGQDSVPIERDVLLPAWRTFAAWTSQYGARKLSQFDSQVFMLTIYSVVLLLLLDSPHYVSLLGTSARTPENRPRLRRHVVQLVHHLLGDRHGA